MKREALIRDLRKYARSHGLDFEVYEARGKGSHYLVRLGDAVTTIQSGELAPQQVRTIKRQLKVNPA
ncbi:hypothetical protein [Methylorubrum sp. POS3]|uniref:hypothetical protein n=1 Tax=Methylorubrum sp. POS3 TaxID=2998492 RepID=UPI00372BB506